MLADKIRSSVVRLRALAAQLSEEHRDIARRVADVLAGCEEIAAGLEGAPELEAPAITQPAATMRLQ